MVVVPLSGTVVRLHDWLASVIVLNFQNDIFTGGVPEKVPACSLYQLHTAQRQQRHQEQQNISISTANFQHNFQSVVEALQHFSPLYKYHEIVVHVHLVRA